MQKDATAGRARSPWVPVPRLSPSTNSQHLRRCVQRLVDQQRQRESDLETPHSSQPPEFTVPARAAWLAQRQNPWNDITFLMALKTVARVPTAATSSIEEVRVFTEYEDTVGTLIAKILKAQSAQHPTAAPPLCDDDTVNAFILKITGRHEYMADHSKLPCEYAHVRACQQARMELHVTLVHRTTFENEDVVVKNAFFDFLSCSSTRAECVDDSTIDSDGRASGLDHETGAAHVENVEGKADSRDSTNRSLGGEQLDLASLVRDGYEDSTTSTDTASMLLALERAILQNALLTLSTNQKSLLWENRDRFLDAPSVLPHVLKCVDWQNHDQVQTALSLLHKWAEPDHPAAYLDLLDREFTNETVRGFAVDKLRCEHDAAFSFLLPQLTELLAFEIHIVSPLALLLIERALQNPHHFGVDLFWLLKDKAYSVRCRDHVGTILNAYVDACSPTMRAQLELQEGLFSGDGFFDRLCGSITTGEATEKDVQAELAALSDMLPSRFVLPVDSRIQVGKLVVDKCRVRKSSTQSPSLWLVFENSEEHCDPVVVIFQSGQDLREQRVALQMVRLMDERWRRQGHYLPMEPYRCVPTSPTTGLIQVVQHAIAIDDLPHDERMVPHSENPSLADWITVNTSDRKSRKDAEYRFTESCAGYCVATWVLGAEDHTSMISSTGRLFLCDLNHILGGRSANGRGGRTDNQCSPMLLTEVIGDTMPDFRRTIETCCAAFAILRDDLPVLVSMLRPMVGAKDESQTQQNSRIEFLITKLVPGLSQDEARTQLRDALYASVGKKYCPTDGCVMLAHVL